MPPMEKVIDRIERLLIVRGVDKRKQKRKLSEVCGISYEGVRQWWTTTNDISNDHIAAIAKHWKASAHWLITGDGGIDIDGANITPYTVGENIGKYLVDRPVRIEAMKQAGVPEVTTASEFVEYNRSKLEQLSEAELMKLIGQISELATKTKE